MKAVIIVFSDIFESLCAREGKSAGAVLTEIGMHRSANTNWKNGINPTNATKKKIANYFGITVNELMTGQIKRPPSETESGSSALWSAVLKSISGLTDEQLCRLLGYVERMKEEEREAALSAKQISEGA